MAYGNADTGILVGDAGDRSVVGGASDWGDLPSGLGNGNHVAANGTGIEVRADRVSVLGNLVGTDGAGSGALGSMGNGDDGIWITRADHGVVSQNVVVNSGDWGIDISDAASGTRHVADLQVADNQVGVDVTGGTIGNSAGGLRALGAEVTDGRVYLNHVAGNGGIGISLDGTENVELSRNSVHDNTACGVKLSNQANGLGIGGLPHPVLGTVVASGGARSGITGTLDYAASFALRRIEVYVDAETEQERYLGEAAYVDVGTHYAWSLEPNGWEAPDPADDRISALATFAASGFAGSYYSFRTSGPGTFCGDGCAATGTGACDIGDPCHAYTCNNGGECVQGAVNVGAQCLDGDACTEDDECAGNGACVGTDPPGACTACADTNPEVGALQDLFCDDGDPCTQDVCVPGNPRSCLEIVVLGVPIRPAAQCGDGNDCTADTCDPGGGGCVHEDRDAGFACEDGNRCTDSAGTCDGDGHCAAGDWYGCPYEQCNGKAGRQVEWACDPLDGCEVVEGLGTCDGQCDLWDLCPYLDGSDPYSCPDLAEGHVCEGCPADCDPAVGGPDDDGDGIPDMWETDGIDMDCDGTLSGSEVAASDNLELTVGVRDILVEVDWMGSDGTHDHAFAPTDFDAVTTAFDGASTDGGLPFRLYVDVSDELPHHEVTSWRFAPSQTTCTDWTGMSHWKTNPAWFAPWRHGLFHYAILAHRYEDCTQGASGWAESGGDDFIVSLRDNPNWDTPIHRQSTFQHELGHDFGFVHGGGAVDPATSVNHPSSVSYRYQFSGLDLSDTLGEEALPDYTHQALDDLDETALLESAAVGYDPLQGPDYILDWEAGAMSPKTAQDVASIDWNQQNGLDVLAYQLDLNRDGSNTDLHMARDEWGSLEPRMRCFPSGEPLMFREGDGGAAEQTPEEAMEQGWLHPRHTVTIDILPGCSGNPVPASGGGKKVQVVVYGDTVTDGADVDLATVRLRSAEPTHTSVEYVDGDGHLDVVAQFEVDDLPNRGTGATLDLTARTQGDAEGRRVGGSDTVTWTATTDGDSDGVPTACDACPTLAATPPSVDGCP